jgi:hypothetical protein
VLLHPMLIILLLLFGQSFLLLFVISLIVPKGCAGTQDKSDDRYNDKPVDYARKYFLHKIIAKI